MKILVKSLKSLGYKISVAESCTGGLVAKMITDVSGASSVFEHGIVTYSNRIKEQFLGVKPETLEKYTVVSEETAIEMAKGVLELSGSDMAIATTGEAGPKSASGKPVGTVCIAIALKDKCVARTFMFAGKRGEIRRQSAKMALNMALYALGETAKKEKLREKAAEAIKKLTSKIKKK